MRRFRLRAGLARAALPCGASQFDCVLAEAPLVWPGMDCGRVRVAPAMPFVLVVARGIRSEITFFSFFSFL
jgi:hypothetical protein